MKRFFKVTSIFGGALSVLMELHFFYAICSIISAKARGEPLTVPYGRLMILDIFISIMSLCIYMSTETYLQRGEDHDE